MQIAGYVIPEFPEPGDFLKNLRTLRKGAHFFMGLSGTLNGLDLPLAAVALTAYCKAP